MCVLIGWNETPHPTHPLPPAFGVLDSQIEGAIGQPSQTYLWDILVNSHKHIEYLESHGEVFIAVGHGVAADVSPAPEAVGIRVVVGYVQSLFSAGLFFSDLRRVFE
jgi:hypothetical protein